MEEENVQQEISSDPESGEESFSAFLAAFGAASEEELLQDITLERIAQIYENEKFQAATRTASGELKTRIEAFEEKLLAQKEEFERIDWCSEHDPSVNNYNKNEFEIKKVMGKWHLKGYSGTKTFMKVPLGVEVVGQCIGTQSPLRVVEIPASVTAIADGAFSNCKELVEVRFAVGSKLKRIGDDAFSGCSNLTTFVIPQGVKLIGRYAFNGCKNLRQIVIPKSVKKVGECAFSGCKLA